MADTFTVFAKFGDVCSVLEEEDRKELIYAINMYGMFGEVVELPYMLEALFISLKDDIDNSKAARAQGSKGAKKRWDKKNRDEEQTSDNTPESGSDTPVSDEVIGGYESSNIGVYSENSNNADSQTNTNQTNTDQSKPKVKKEGRFTPPTLDQVRAHCLEEGYTFDPEAFFAFYESKGWKVGRNPMKSWTAACVTWQKRERKEERRSAGDIYSQL